MVLVPPAPTNTREYNNNNNNCPSVRALYCFVTMIRYDGDNERWRRIPGEEREKKIK